MPKESPQESPGPEAIRLENQEELRERYYEGAQVPSPMDGFLEPVRVRYGGAGDGTVLFDCLSSSLRFELTIPRATRTERRKVREMLDRGEDPVCPRHGRGTSLIRNDRDLVCPECGVRFARVG
jgi:hypothetical protein